MTTKTLIATIILIILFFGTGIFLGTKIKKTSAPSNQENTYQAGWDAAKKQLEKKGIGSVPAGMEIKNLSGTIDLISGNTLTLKNVSSADILSDPSLDTRIVQVSADTKFYQLVQKDGAQFQKEMEDFQKKMQEQAASATPTNQPLTPPQPQEKKELALSDLVVGQSVAVTSSENIGDKKEFTATEISVQPVPVMPEANTTTNSPASSPVPPMPTINSSAPTAPINTPAPTPPMPSTAPVPAPGSATLTAPPAPAVPLK
ncbi:MAG: hypothetical protein WA064_01050 [Candidatus Moraniibacteriota bacterium]